GPPTPRNLKRHASNTAPPARQVATRQEIRKLLIRFHNARPLGFVPARQMRDNERMIGVDYHDQTAVVRLRHGKVNALDLELLQAISDTFRGLDADAVVLTGVGKAFSAGVDLKRIVEGGAKYTQAFLPALSDALLAVFDHPRPVGAAINGDAIAGGCVLAAACDARLMSAGTIGPARLRGAGPVPTAALAVRG